MQKIYPRANPAPLGASENTNVIPAQQIEEAIREYETALAMEPTHADAENNLGIALIQVGKPQELAPFSA